MANEQVEQLVLEASVIVRAAAEVLLERRPEIGRLAGLEEGGREVKLLADQVANDLLLEPLCRTGLGVLSEETGWSEGTAPGALRWVVDPLDGSLNYLRGMAYCGISVGLCEGGKPVAGVLFDLNERKLVTGIPGQGAWADGVRLEVSGVDTLERAMLTTGFPARMSYDQDTLGAFIRQIQRFQKIRMLGSAVHSCLLVASGRCDAYYERDVMIWDVAGGLPIVEAAGGHYDLSPGSREHAVRVWACTPGLTKMNPDGD